MKRQTITSLLIAAAFAFGMANTARAEDIGSGSIRITVSAEQAANLKVRYHTENGSADQAVTAAEVLHLSSFNVLDNGNDLPELQPTQNAFNLYKDGNIGFIVTGDSEDEIVRLSLKEAGVSAELLLDFQWMPKFEILDLDAAKVEVLNADDEVLQEVGPDAVYLTSANGMAITFAVTDDGIDDGQDDGEDDGNIDVGGDELDNGQPASGGCSMTAATAAGSMDLTAALAFGGMVLVARRRLKK